MKIKIAIALSLVVVSLSGCTSMKNAWPWSKKTDDTVLPGSREEVLPPEQLPRAETKSATTTDSVGSGTTTRTSSSKLALCEPSDPTYPECLTPDAAAPDVPSDVDAGVDEESLNPQ
jgi:hypothetical protein